MKGTPMNTHPTPEQVRDARAIVTGAHWLTRHFAPADVAILLIDAWAVLRINATRPAPMIIRPQGAA
jgi:hypothetical protein